MVERITWNGRKYRRYPESRHQASRYYFQRSYSGGTALLHRDVWEHHNGPIPAGYEVHHIDHNPTNNAIENLALLSRAEHMGAHQWSDERKASQREHLARIRPLTKAWHASPEGIAKHRETGGLAYAGFKPEPKPCAHCGKVFETRKLGNIDLYCSNACKSAARRASGVDDEIRACVVCGSSFTANKYTKIKTCCRSCGGVARGRTLRTGL